MIITKGEKSLLFILLLVYAFAFSFKGVLVCFAGMLGGEQSIFIVEHE
jgi:hypothetical protein